VKITRLTTRLMFLLLALPVALVGILLVVVYQQPLPPLDYPGFDACVLPCWAGIIPNETRTLDAPQVMASHLMDAELEFSQVVTQINFTIIRRDQLVQGVIYDDRGYVYSVRLMLKLPLWRLVDLLGTPACVMNQTSATGEGIVTIWWVMDDRTVSSTLIAPKDWNPSVEIFTLGSSQQPETCASPFVKQWRGFAPLWFYEPD
jgi:hypothetical protein